jgi:hypothetical protein
VAYRFPWFKNLPARHHLSFLRKGTCRGFDLVARDDGALSSKLFGLLGVSVLYFAELA